MAKEKQLGPNVTYHNLDGTAPVVRMTFGSSQVEFKDGEAVDLVDEIGEDRAAKALAKLAGNHFFDVDGSDADHDEARENVARLSGVERRKAPARKPTVKRSVAKRIEKEDAEDAETGDNGDANETADEDLPEGVETPDNPTLENTTRPRLPRARR